MNHLSLLQSLGFRLVGAWKIGAKGLDFAIETEVRSTTKSLYAFVVGTEDLYIGKATGRFAGRLSGYRRPAGTQQTNIRIHPLIAGAKEEISIYHFQPTEEVHFRGIILNLSAALEDALIERISPKWNMNGKEKTEPNQALEPTTIAVTDRAFARSAPATVAAHL